MKQAEKQTWTYARPNIISGPFNCGAPRLSQQGPARAGSVGASIENGGNEVHMWGLQRLKTRMIKTTNAAYAKMR